MRTFGSVKARLSDESHGNPLSLRRLESRTRNGTAATCGYDANGNRTAVTTAGGTTIATFDAQDRVLTFGTRTYTHTPHGDVAGWTDSATSTTTSLTYDVQGNLRQWTQPGTTITYTVDGRNRRIGTAVNGVPVQGFLWQGQLRPVAELDGTGALVSRFVYGSRINVPEYLARGGTTYRLVTDHLGSVRLVIDTTTDQVVQALAYDPWGVVVQDTNPGFQPFGYAGGLYDYRTGLVRFGVRDYDATTGRWLAKDPIGFAGRTAGLYAYAHALPSEWFDPEGLEAIGVVVGAVYGTISGGLGAYAQGGSATDVVISAVGGGLAGAMLGALDFTGGVATTAALARGALATGALNGLANLWGQGFSLASRGSLRAECFNVGSTIGAAIGNGVGFTLGRTVGGAVVAVGAGRVAPWGAAAVEALSGGGPGVMFELAGSGLDLQGRQ